MNTLYVYIRLYIYIQLYPYANRFVYVHDIFVHIHRYASMTNLLRGLAGGRVIVALEGGYNLRRCVLQGGAGCCRLLQCVAVCCGGTCHRCPRRWI